MGAEIDHFPQAHFFQTVSLENGLPLFSHFPVTEVTEVFKLLSDPCGT